MSPLNSNDFNTATKTMNQILAPTFGGCILGYSIAGHYGAIVGSCAALALGIFVYMKDRKQAAQDKKADDEELRRMLSELLNRNVR